MTWMITISIILLFISTLISLAIALYAWRNRRITGAKPFTYLMLATALWSFGEALVILSSDVDLMLLLTKIQYFGIVAAPVFWLLFTIDYAGYQTWLTPWKRMALFIVPAVVLLAVWTTDTFYLY